MALPKQEQIELLGEILDYILEQLEKSPDKIDRLNIPGLEGQSDLSSAILAILENETPPKSCSFSILPFLHMTKPL